uniref:Uncharacterized protein n=1 Tax=uncultured Desulfobacterium sp. TaxID=201089 RepID=E1YLA0_9BACT|nr:unknown protein [uncultured Desulfobacterium sp.]
MKMFQTADPRISLSSLALQYTVFKEQFPEKFGTSLFFLSDHRKSSWIPNGLDDVGMAGINIFTFFFSCNLIARGIFQSVHFNKTCLNTKLLKSGNQLPEKTIAILWFSTD